jgi:uncharacterized protein (DUF885 family)
MRLVTLAAAAFALAAAAALAQTREPAKNTALHALFDREFRNTLEEFPEQATFLGIDGYDHRLTDLSPQAVARRKARVARVTSELERFDPKKLSAQDRISRDVMLTDLRLARDESALYRDLPFATVEGWMPVSPMHGPQRGMSSLAKATPFRRTRDYDNYLKRLDAVPVALEQQVAAMRAGMKSGWVPPQAAIQRVPAMFDEFAGADVTATPLWQPFTKFPAEMGTEEQRRWTEAGRHVLQEKVHPAFAAYRRFLAAEYLPAAARKLAASALPAGPAYYALRVREATTTTLTPDEIHAIGLREVARIRGEMDAVVAKTGFKGTFPEFLNFINTDARFLFSTPEARLAAYRDIAKRADAELPPLFAELPRTPYGIRAMDPYEGDNADHYSQPAMDGSRAGYFDANVNNLQNRPSHEMEATLLHEAVPGHHLQIARSLELGDLPLFRRAAGYNAYQEGWALYAESLGYEMGFYKDPYNHFGALSAEMLRACRLVIDTGLHSKGWEREPSIRYLVDNAGVKEAFAIAEVDRYIVWPGQALGYKIGELRIKALRAKAKAALGERFDVRHFHNAVLDDGAVPLTVLEGRIDEWIRLKSGENR